MRRPIPVLALVVFLLPLCGLSARAEKHRKAPPALPAAEYPLHETHAKEQVTIAAEPGDTKEARPDTRLDYYHHGFLPIRVIITNDSNETLNLDEARIHFVAADNTVVQAATDEELERRMFTRKSTQPRTIPMPGPIPSIKMKKTPVNKQILDDEADFAFASTTVEPHSTASGYLFYDVRTLDEPVLSHATLEVRRVRIAGPNTELYSFEIPLKPTPEKPAASAAAGTKSGAGEAKKD